MRVVPACGEATGAGIGHPGVVRSGLDGRTVALGVSAIVLAVVLGAVAGMSAGPVAHD